MNRDDGSRLRRSKDDRFDGSERRRENDQARYNVITRLVSVHRADGTTGGGGEAGGKRDYTWRGERQLILTFLSKNQSVVIPEAACVISSLPHSHPQDSLSSS